MSKEAVLTEKIARFVSETDAGQIPSEAFEMAKKGIIDCVGVCLAGSGHRENSFLVNTVQAF